MIKHMLDERLIHYERDGWEKEDKRLKERRDLPIDKWRYLMIPHLTHTNAVPQVILLHLKMFSSSFFFGYYLTGENYHAI